MGGRGTFASGNNVAYSYETVGKIEGVKVLQKLDKNASGGLPEEAHSSGAYIMLNKDGNFKMYREYDNNNFLYQSDSNDFTVLMNKVSEEQAKRIVAATEKNKALFLDNPYLKFKVNPQIALSIIYSLIMTIKNKSVLPCNHLETFDFMVDRLIGDLYE